MCFLLLSDLLPPGILYSLNFTVISTTIQFQVIPGRMSLLVILFLVIINVFNNVRSGAPSSGTSKLNAIDKFMMTCVFMIFSAIFEYALILSIYTLKLDERNYSINTSRPSLCDRIHMVYRCEQPPLLTSLCCFRNPRILDLISIILFSTTFTLYNFHYWAIADHKYDD